MQQTIDTAASLDITAQSSIKGLQTLLISAIMPYMISSSNQPVCGARCKFNSFEVIQFDQSEFNSPRASALAAGKGLARRRGERVARPKA